MYGTLAAIPEQMEGLEVLDRFLEGTGAKGTKEVLSGGCQGSTIQEMPIPGNAAVAELELLQGGVVENCECLF